MGEAHTRWKPWNSRGEKRRLLTTAPSLIGSRTAPATRLSARGRAEALARACFLERAEISPGARFACGPSAGESVAKVAQLPLSRPGCA